MKSKNNFYSSLSQFLIDPCTSNPCSNQATCVSFDTVYSCQCPFGVTGTNCEIIINECISSPCLNQGLCSQPGIGQYECSCIPGFTGRRCEVRISSCIENLCLNEGTCIDSTNSLGYLCQCAVGFTGNLKSC